MLIFKNDGMIPVEAFTTFGVNAKPNTDNPIGYFGTGLKYAIAVAVRLGGRVELYRGSEQYAFSAKDIEFRGKDFTTIRMKRRKDWLSRWRYEQLPFTTELGKNWEPWMAVRELESNCRDENGMSIIDVDRDDYVVEDGDKTTILVFCPEMDNAYENETIFLQKQQAPIFENSMLEIYEGPSKYMFYRGLRVREFNKPSRFTYNFTMGVTLTEDRTSKYPWFDDGNIVEAIMRSTDQELVNRYMDIEEDEWHEGSLPFDQPYATPAATYQAALGERAVLGRPLPGRMLSYYKKTTVELNPDRKIRMEMTQKDIKRVLEWAEAQQDAGSIVAACKSALRDLDIPF